MNISASKLTKRFGAFAALDNVSLDIRHGELVALVGPSGSGKTTLLRIVAGLEFPDSGYVKFGAEDITQAAPAARNVGFVFQHYALFRHMTVFENVAFGLRVRPRSQRPCEAKIRARVLQMLELIQLQTLAHRFPSELSGGQRQRVALARALAIEPKVLLLDEPFGALDAKVRVELRNWLRQLHNQVDVTTVLVTHDQEEALEVADRVAVMSQGRIEQVGTPEEVYNMPANPFVYGFLGNVNLFHGRVDAGEPVIDHTAREQLVFVRPHSLQVARTPDRNAFRARTTHINTAGSFVKVEAMTDWGATVRVEMSRDRFLELALRKDEEVYIAPRHVHIFDSPQALA